MDRELAYRAGSKCPPSLYGLKNPLHDTVVTSSDSFGGSHHQLTFYLCASLVTAARVGERECYSLTMRISVIEVGSNILADLHTH